MWTNTSAVKKRTFCVLLIFLLWTTWKWEKCKLFYLLQVVTKSWQNSNVPHSSSTHRAGSPHHSRNRRKVLPVLSTLLSRAPAPPWPYANLCKPCTCWTGQMSSWRAQIMFRASQPQNQGNLVVGMVKPTTNKVWMEGNTQWRKFLRNSSIVLYCWHCFNSHLSC